MKVCIVATHSFPIPMKDLHTGDVVILELARTLKEMGHEVWMAAPAGTQFPRLIVMRASYGQYPPSSEECELECFEINAEKFKSFDIIHDFSVSKRITRRLNELGFWNTCMTLLGGPWRQSWEPHNLVVWSRSQRNRVLRGATDFEGTPMPTMGGENGPLVRNAKVVSGGINTGYYCPNKYHKEDYFLWLGRWHPARGYEFAIQLARETGINLVMAGEHPDNELFPNQRDAAYQALKLARGCENIKFIYLPKDPNHHRAKRELMREARALLYTVQFHEPWGLAQIESLSCGTPVIGSNFGSVPEIVDNKRTGFVCDNTISSFSAAIDRVDDIDPVICRKKAAKQYDIRVMVKNYLKLYSEITRGGDW